MSRCAGRTAKPVTVSGQDDPATLRVARVVDEWRVDSHWWAEEINRDYYLLELDGGQMIEIYREADCWVVTGMSD